MTKCFENMSLSYDISYGQEQVDITYEPVECSISTNVVINLEIEESANVWLSVLFPFTVNAGFISNTTSNKIEYQHMVMKKLLLIRNDVDNAT